MTKLTYDRTQVAFSFSFRKYSFPNKIFDHFCGIIEMLSFRLELHNKKVIFLAHESWFTKKVKLTVVIRSKMAVNGARVSSLNRTARSAIDTANFKIGGCLLFQNVHSFLSTMALLDHFWHFTWFDGFLWPTIGS